MQVRQDPEGCNRMNFLLVWQREQNLPEVLCITDEENFFLTSSSGSNMTSGERAKKSPAPNGQTKDLTDRKPQHANRLRQNGIRSQPVRWTVSKVGSSQYGFQNPSLWRKGFSNKSTRKTNVLCSGFRLQEFVNSLGKFSLFVFFK